MREKFKLLSRRIAVCTAAIVLAACADERSGAVPEPAGAREATASIPASQTLRSATGLSHIPMPRDKKGFSDRLDHHFKARFPADHPGGAVLLDVTVDQNGIVRQVEVVTPPETPAVVSRAVLLDKDPKTGKQVERVMEGKYDAALGPAARAALLESRFSPAMRDGQPVATTYRTTIWLGPAARQR